jgi:hypothetical protein
MIHDNKEHLGEDKSSRDCIVEFIQDHTLGLEDRNNTRIHCRNALGKAFLRRRGTKSGKGPAEGMAGAPPMARERRRRLLGRPRVGGKGTAQVGSPAPPFYTQPPSWPNILAKVCPDYPPPWIFRPWGRIFRPRMPESSSTQIFIKQKFFLTKNLNLCA